MIQRAVARSEMLPPSATTAAAAEPPTVWCASHHDGSSHAPHVHADVLLSGTYYAAVPPGAAPLELFGPVGWAGRAEPAVFRFQARASPPTPRPCVYSTVIARVAWCTCAENISAPCYQCLSAGPGAREDPLCTLR